MMHCWGRWGLVILLLWTYADSYAQLVVFAPLKVAPYSSSAAVTTLAGTAEKGNVDAVGMEARFAYPIGSCRSC
jgi:hypothetical protein